MTQAPDKSESRWAELSDDVLESVETSRKQAIDAIRKFVEQVGGEVPDESRRKNVIEAALDLTEELVTGRIEFVRSVVRSAGQAVGNK
jgi:DNA anti-recombination protein RmuC